MPRFQVGPENQRVWQLALPRVLITAKNCISAYKYNRSPGLHLLPFSSKPTFSEK